jgi:CRISPR-associated protein Cmr5
MSQATPAQQPATSQRQSLEQQRAAQAASDIREARRHPDSREYRSLVEGLPAMILANGLGQTCAYLLSRAEGSQQKVEFLLYRHLERWVRRQIPQLKQGGLLAALTNADVGTYRRAQVEALAYLQWLKRFAQAEILRGEHRRGS